MTNPAPYSKKGERWVNHTVQPGSYVVQDPRPHPPPPPPYTKPTGQTWARDPRPPPNVPPSSLPPNPYAIQPIIPPPAPASAPIPPAFQTPKGKTPRFYDPDDFRKFTETNSSSSAASYQPQYATPLSGGQGRSYLPVIGDSNKRGPYSERLNRTEEAELLKTCIRLNETYGAPSTQNKWWQTAAADFSVYRRKNGRGDLQAPTAKRRVEQAVAKRKQEIKEGKESDEPEEYVAALNEWVEHTDKLEKGELEPLSSKQAAEAKLDAELERIKKEREQAEKDNPLPTPPPSTNTPTSAGPRDSIGGNSHAPVVVSDSPPRPPPQPLAPHPPTHYPVYAPPSGPLTHHGIPAPGLGPPHIEPPRPNKRQRLDDDEVGQLEQVMLKVGSALDVMTKLAASMHESQQAEREERQHKRRRSTPEDRDVDMNGSTDDLFSPAPGTQDPIRLDDLEKKLEDQREANDALQGKVDDLTSRITKFTEEAVASEGREKDRDKKIDKILQVLKKHFQGAGSQMQT